MQSPEAIPAPADAPADRAAERYGCMVGELPVLLPPGVPVEYVADAAVHRFARAPARIVGLAQLRGLPVPVLDPSRDPAPAPAGVRRLHLLVLGSGAEAGALVVDGPPVPLDGPWRPAEASPPRSVPFHPALEPPLARGPAPGGALWWPLRWPQCLEVLVSADAGASARGPADA